MRQRFIRVCSVAIIICGICGCAQIVGDTFDDKKVYDDMLDASPAETVEPEHTETGDEEKDSVTDTVEQEEQMPNSSPAQEEHEPEKEKHTETEQVISDFLHMDSVEFQENYDKDELYQRGILYCGQESWKTHIDYVEEFQQYTLENITAIRFYKEQPVPIYLDMNIGDRTDQYEEEISIYYDPDYAVSLYSKPAEDGFSYIQEISFVKIESYLNRAPLNLYDFMEKNYYHDLESLVNETWILSPDGDRAACISNGGLPKYASQIYIWQGDGKPLTVFRREWQHKIVGWIDNDHLVCYHDDWYPVLVHLERNEIEEVSRENCDYDTYGVQYYIQGNNLVAQPYVEEQYQWQIQEKDGEIYILDPD